MHIIYDSSFREVAKCALQNMYRKKCLEKKKEKMELMLKKKNKKQEKTPNANQD